MTGPRTAPMGEALRAMARRMEATGETTAPRPHQLHTDTIARLCREGWLVPAAEPGRYALTYEARRWLDLSSAGGAS